MTQKPLFENKHTTIQVFSRQPYHNGSYCHAKETIRKVIRSIQFRKYKEGGIFEAIILQLKTQVNKTNL